MHKLLVPILLTLAAVCRLYGATESYPVSGRVIDRLTRQPVPFAAVVISGQPGKGAMADSAGKFTIAQVKPGIYRLSASMLGYRSALTSEYIVSAGTPFIEIELEKEAQGIETVTVMPSPVRRTAESPVSVRTIGLREIEKSPGSNRDIARIVRSYPGVSFSPVGYRNDLIVRGGGPSENRFFMDGIEIPNINHFATQGASGGPVSLVNSDLIREIDFYTGAFPADRAGALSSVLDFRLRDGDPDRQRFKATLGASEVGLSGSGHIGEKATFLFSARQSYLQMLFKLLGLPFLPNYIDAQAKVRIRFSQRDELTVLALAGIDNMRLNTDEKGEETEYLLSYLPRLRQETFTVGASYRHYAGRHAQTVTLSHSYLNNRNTKYLGQRRVVGGQSDPAPAGRQAENVAAGREPLAPRTLDAARGRRAELLALHEPYFPTLLRRTGRHAELPHAARTDRLGSVRRSRLCLGRRPADRIGRNPGRRERLLGGNRPAVASAFAEGIGPLRSERAMDGRRQRRTVLSTASLHRARIRKRAGGKGQPRTEIHARGRDLGRFRLEAARPADRIDRGISQVLHRRPALARRQHSADLSGQRLRHGRRRAARPDSRRAGLRHRGDGQMADPGQAACRGLRHGLPQRVPQRTTGPVYRLGLGQPLRAEPERNLRTAQGMEHRRETERDRRSALHALRHRKVVAQGGMGRPRAPLLRLFAVQRGASARLSPSST